MKFRVIISLILITVLITCVGTTVTAAGENSGVLFSMVSVTGAEGEYILSCESAETRPAGIFATFPGPVSIVSTTLPESQYRLNGNSLACAIIDEETCSFQINCADLQPGTLSILWEEFASGLSGDTEISVSDAGDVAVSSPGDTGMGGNRNSPSVTVQQSPFACIVFTVIVSLAAACVYTGRRRGDSQ